MSHDRLLAASGQHRIHVERLPLAWADLAPSDLMGGPVTTCELAAIPESAKVARDFTRVTLQQWGLGEHTDTAELVVSELVTNALRHGLLSAPRTLGEHPVGLRLLPNAPYLICMVTDPGRAGPVRLQAGTGAEGGRGLQVVQACSLQWGWQPLESGLDSAGKVVWALLHAPELPWPAGRPGPDQPPVSTRTRRPPQAGQESRSSNSPSLAPRRKASISAGV